MPTRETSNPQDYWPARSSPSQRRHHRLAVPITVVLDGRSYPANNWSMGGVLLHGVDREFSPDEQMPAELVLNFQGFVIGVRTLASVTRVDVQRRQLALAFEDLGERERALLDHFARGLLSGEMSDVDGVIVRLDMPVTPTETLPAETSTSAHDQKRRRVLASAAYLIGGALLLVYISLLLYFQVWRINIETAVVEMPQEAIVALDQSLILRLPVSIGQHLASGALLMEVQEVELEREVATARLKVASAALEVETLREQERVERGNTPFYRGIFDEKLRLARERVRAAQAARSTAESELRRSTDLVRSGFVSEATQERARMRLEAEDAALKQAEADLSIARQAVVALQRDQIYDGQSLLGELSARQRDLELAKVRLVAAQEELAELDRRATRQQVRAPFDAIVKRLDHGAGATLNRGETLALLERTDLPPRVLAFLTQDEVAQLQIGSVGRAYVPALDRSFAVEIVRVDTQAGFTPEAQSLPRWQEQGERDAIARLAVQDPRNMAGLTAGMPVQLSLPRHWPSTWQRLRTSLVVAFSS